MLDFNPRKEAVAQEAVAEIRRLLRERMGRFGFREADVRPGRDHDGDPVIFVEAAYDVSDAQIDPKVAISLIGEVRRALEALGEDRFPHIRHRIGERQKVVNAR